MSWDTVFLLFGVVMRFRSQTFSFFFFFKMKVNIILCCWSMSNLKIADMVTFCCRPTGPMLIDNKALFPLSGRVLNVASSYRFRFSLPPCVILPDRLKWLSYIACTGGNCNWLIFEHDYLHMIWLSVKQSVSHYLRAMLHLFSKPHATQCFDWTFLP